MLSLPQRKKTKEEKLNESISVMADELENIQDYVGHYSRDIINESNFFEFQLNRLQKIATELKFDIDLLRKQVKVNKKYE